LSGLRLYLQSDRDKTLHRLINQITVSNISPVTIYQSSPTATIYYTQTSLNSSTSAVNSSQTVSHCTCKHLTHTTVILFSGRSVNNQNTVCDLQVVEYGVLRSTVGDSASLWQALFRKWLIAKLCQDR